MLNDTIITWRLDLNRLLLYYKNRKSQFRTFFYLSIYIFYNSQYQLLLVRNDYSFSKSGFWEHIRLLL